MKIKLYQTISIIIISLSLCLPAFAEVNKQDEKNAELKVEKLSSEVDIQNAISDLQSLSSQLERVLRELKIKEIKKQLSRDYPKPGYFQNNYLEGDNFLKQMAVILNKLDIPEYVAYQAKLRSNQLSSAEEDLTTFVRSKPGVFFMQVDYLNKRQQYQHARIYLDEFVKSRNVSESAE